MNTISIYTVTKTDQAGNILKTDQFSESEAINHLVNRDDLFKKMEESDLQDIFSQSKISVEDGTHPSFYFTNKEQDIFDVFTFIKDVKPH
jgi:hypothetical protein